MRERPAVLILLVPLVAVFSMAAFPFLWTRADPRDCDIALGTRAPDAAHIFGTNPLGCDYYAMTVYGARPAILVGVCTTAVVVAIGGLAGLVAGYRGGWVDAVISRVTEIFATLPALLGVLVFLSLLRAHSITAVVTALALLGWPPIARITRSAAITVRNAGYVRAARGLGASPTRILLRHVLPDTLGPVIAVGSTGLGAYIAAEGTLSYLGVGLRPPAVSWGVMINQARELTLTGHPYLLLFPGGFLVVTVVCLVLVGDAAGASLDPRSPSHKPTRSRYRADASSSDA
ncbi:ABC transporter permease [Actinocrispum wychmicini]|uniref:Peptide/nickel transport system permease protein/oligopeptide transport system permease protein n=1 Tax=Actinocrispum wychmicini TaxID=1213861 RepID=A0A4R2K053_9PSEU|nr:ABC transporter permease [Actinocrispum wychmicini]TCO59705.1 peptide/nickel transport system permease protein/oligopeptide transport system permease protein [Actinocrispum wychmicini]